MTQSTGLRATHRPIVVWPDSQAGLVNLPVPSAKISHLLLDLTRTPRLGEKCLICATGTEINLAHLPHIAWAHIAGCVGSRRTQALPVPAQRATAGIPL